MANESDSTTNLVDDRTRNSVKEQMDVKADIPTEKADTSVFVNSEPIREEQVQNAVKFLSHPKVRGSPVMYRRSFLERKGLTKEEIDEAFRQVPDPTPSVTSSQPVVPSKVDGQLKSSLPIHQQTSTQTVQPAATLSRWGPLSRFHWSHAFLGVGLLAISGAGTAVLFKKTVVPHLKSWIRKVVLEEEEEDQPLVKKLKKKPNLAEEAAAAAKAAAAAASDVARASQEMLMSKTEEKRYFTELTNLLDVQIREMKSMSYTLQKLEGESNTLRAIAALEQADQTKSALTSREYYANGKVNNNIHSGTLSPPQSVEPSVAPHPKSYMEIMAMVQRGEKPSNIREINDQPPNPNQPVPNPRLVPKPKPWEVGYSQSSSSNGLLYQENRDSFNPASQSIQLNGDGSVPWWQQKNARTSEIENGDEAKAAGSSSSVPNERPVQRSSWVPPQPPPVAMAEAAAAIRQPKRPLFQREQLTDDQLLGRSEISDDLQRITKISESGGVEANGDSSVISVTEIQTEEKPYMEA